MSTRISREKVQLIIDDLARELPDLTFTQGDDGSGNIFLQVRDGAAWSTTERGCWIRIVGTAYAGFPTPTLVTPATDGRTLVAQVGFEVQAAALIGLPAFSWRVVARLVQQDMPVEVYAVATANVGDTVAQQVAAIVNTALLAVIPVSTSKSNIGA
jgi:hypothetical protein